MRHRNASPLGRYLLCYYPQRDSEINIYYYICNVKTKSLCTRESNLPQYNSKSHTNSTRTGWLQNSALKSIDKKSVRLMPPLPTINEDLGENSCLNFSKPFVLFFCITLDLNGHYRALLPKNEINLIVALAPIKDLKAMYKSLAYEISSYA